MGFVMDDDNGKSGLWSVAIWCAMRSIRWGLGAVESVPGYIWKYRGDTRFREVKTHYGSSFGSKYSYTPTTKVI